MDFELYAQRLLNPFRGTMHTIRHGCAEAVTADGVHWDIYVTNTDLLQDNEDPHHVQVGDIRYGSWSAADGLKRGRLSPSADFRRMEAMGTTLFEHLLCVHRDIPFSLRDHYELWLLDTEARPLALLHSACEENELDSDIPIVWNAGIAAREHFRSPAMDVLYSAPAPAASDYLTHYINGRAGRRPAAQWFRRPADGTGAGLHGIGLPRGLEGRTLGEMMFPVFFLSDTDHDETHHRLIDDFYAWQAPFLLLLPQLDSATRILFEQLARRQVFAVEKLFRLYPQIIDQTAIQAARVEAKMRHSQQMPEKQDDPLSTFYIELSPSADM